MKDIIIKNLDEKTKNEIISFSSFEKLINNLKKYYLMLYLKKSYLILQILKKRNESKEKIQNYILNKYKTQKHKKTIIKEKNYIIIEKILKKRIEAANLIRKNYINYSRWLKLHIMYKQAQGCYTIFPSINNVTNINIKIYTNNLLSEFSTFPLIYCPYRNCFFIDIKKNKFINCKIIRFHFIVNKRIIIDSHYKSKEINGIFVNEIDFNEYDKRIEKNICKYNKIHGFDYLYNNEIYLRKLSSDSNTKDNSFSLLSYDSDDDLYNKNNNFVKSINNFSNLINNNFQIFEEKKIRRCSIDNYNQSILKNKYYSIKSSDKIYIKNSHDKLFNCPMKKVSFGKVQFSY